MMVVRLVVLAVLFYIAWRLLRGIWGDREPVGPDRVPGDADEERVEDTLVEDPVCHTLIPKHQAIRLRHNDTTYYFCSDTCCDTFIESARGEE